MKYAFMVAEDFHIGVGYLIAHLKQQGHEVRLFFDPRQGARGYFRNPLVAKILNVENYNIREMKKWKPDACCFSCVTATFQWGLKMAERVKKEVGCRIIFGGVHATLVPDEVRKHSYIDDVVVGDGISFFGGKFDPDNNWPDRDSFFKELPPEHQKVQLFMSSFGCPFNCITGDTKINTVIGDIPVKDLVGKKVGVYTYNPETKQVFISEATNIWKVGKREIMRVYFDDGTHINCTHEHKFLTFKNSNKYVSVREIEKEAKDLIPGDSVRSIGSFTSQLGYTEIYWGRRRSERRARLVMEYVIKRKIRKGEIVHHKDKNKNNDYPDNLMLCRDRQEHLNHHPEISEMMINNNPSKKFSHEYFVALGKKQKGVRRSLKSRINIRNSKLGVKNPNYKDGKRSGRTRILEVNHKVLRIQKLWVEDVYDIEVPETHWFFANNVLMHNCSFCGNEQLRKIGRLNIKRRTVDGCIKELKHLKDKYDMKYVLFVDDIFTVDKKWLMEFSEAYQALIKLPFACFIHAKFIDEEVADTLKKMGCHTAWMGIQSGFEPLRKEILSRNETNTDIINAAKLVKSRGIKLMIDHIFGIPFENDLAQDLSYALYKEIKPDVVNAYELLYFPKAKIIEHALRCGYLKHSDVPKIEKGEGIVYQQGNKGNHFFDIYAKSFVSVPLDNILFELLPMSVIKLIIAFKSGRGFMPLVMIQNELFFTYRAILKKMRLM